MLSPVPGATIGAAPAPPATTAAEPSDHSGTTLGPVAVAIDDREEIEPVAALRR